jgi:DNA-binding PadR family transcriptional regulator
LKPNPTACTLLGFLHDRPMTGWELSETVELTVGSFWNVTRSQVYRELHKLEEAGMVVAGERGPRDKRPYEISVKGRAVFREWIDQEPGPLVSRFPLMLTTWFGDHLPPDRLEKFLRLHRERHEKRHAVLSVINDEITDTSTPAARVARFGLLFEQMMLAWFDSLREFGGEETRGAEPGEARPSQPRRLGGFGMEPDVSLLEPPTRSSPAESSPQKPGSRRR